MNNYSYVSVNGGIEMGENKVESCNCTVIHKDIVERVKESLPSEEILYDLADLFKAFSDSTRIKILHALFKEEMCVCDIVHLLGMTQSAVSHQLRILKQSRLVRVRKQGKSVYYSLNDNYIRQIFNYGLNHIKEIYNV